MTMMKPARLALTLVLGISFFATTASAQLLDTAGSMNLNGSAAADETSIDTAVDVSVDAEADAGATSTDDEADTGSTFNFSIERASMDANTDYAVTDADFVRSAASLESYASATVRADERLESLTVEEGRLDMEYRKAAKFLWLIPASMKVRVTVDGNGDVAVKYPWYSFLMQADESRTDLEARLTNDIDAINDSMEVMSDAELAGEASGSGVQADPEVRRWARIIEGAYVAVSGSARADASAEAS